MSNEMIERVAKAIEEYGQHRSYGLYDYSSYKGSAEPHQVKDEKTGKVLFKSFDSDKAYKKWQELSQCYVAKAAIQAMREPTEEMIVINQ